MTLPGAMNMLSVGDIPEPKRRSLLLQAGG